MLNSTSPTQVVAPKLLTIREAAKLLGICERTLYDLTNKQGILPCVRIGRSVHYDPGDLAKFIEQQKQTRKQMPSENQTVTIEEGLQHASTI